MYALFKRGGGLWRVRKGTPIHPWHSMLLIVGVADWEGELWECVFISVLQLWARSVGRVRCGDACSYTSPFLSKGEGLV